MFIVTLLSYMSCSQEKITCHIILFGRKWKSVSLKGKDQSYLIQVIAFILILILLQFPFFYFTAKDWHKKFIALIRMAWDNEPDERPSFTQINTILKELAKILGMKIDTIKEKRIKTTKKMENSNLKLTTILSVETNFVHSSILLVDNNLRATSESDIIVYHLGETIKFFREKSNVVSLKMLKHFKGHDSYIKNMIEIDEKVLLYGTTQKISIVNKNYEIEGSLSGHTSEVIGICAIECAPSFFCSYSSDSLRVWNINTKVCTQEIVFNESYQSINYFSSKGKAYIVLGGQHFIFYSISLEEYPVLEIFEIFQLENPVNKLIISEDLFFVASHNKTLSVFNFEGKKLNNSLVFPLKNFVFAFVETDGLFFIGGKMPFVEYFYKEDPEYFGNISRPEVNKKGIIILMKVIQHLNLKILISSSSDSNLTFQQIE